MGNKQSSTNTVSINTSTTIEKMTSTMSSTEQTTYQSSFNTQIAKIINKGSIKGNVKIAQELNISQQVKAQITESVSKEVSEDIKSGIDAELDQTSKTKSGLFSFMSPASSTKNITDIKDAFKAVLSDSITLEKVQKIVNDTTNGQLGEIYNYGEIIGDVKIDQKTVIRMSAINILSSVFKDVNKYLQDNKSKARVEQAAKTEAGLGEGGEIMFFIACIFLCICSMVLLVMLPKIIGSGTEAYSTARTGGMVKQ